MPPDSSPTIDSSDPLLGQQLAGTYEIVRKIGAGGMGSVYEARHVRLPKRFAVKVLLPEVAADQVTFERFRREAETTSSLGNAHITEVIDFNFLPDGSPFMVMEYLEGDDLGNRLEKTGPLPPRRAAQIISDVASALTSAHARGILHRDIKPANIFICKRDREGELVKLLDFGAAKSRNKRQSNLTAFGQVVGTPWYMSPEQARGHELDPRSDQFSLAVVLYEALTGKLPFEADDPTQVLFKIVDEAPVPIRSRDETLPEELEAFMNKALSKSAEDRFSSVAEFAAQLLLILDNETAANANPRFKATQQISAVADSLPGSRGPKRPTGAGRPSKPRTQGEIPVRARTGSEVTVPSEVAVPRPRHTTEPSVGPPPRKLAPLVVGLVVGLGAVLGTAYLLTRGPAAEPTAVVVPPPVNHGPTPIAPPKAPEPPRPPEEKLSPQSAEQPPRPPPPEVKLTKPEPKKPGPKKPKPASNGLINDL